jgi:hypothetical protein
MSLNAPQALIQLGFDSDFWDLSSETTLVALQDYLDDAANRLKSWIGNSAYSLASDSENEMSSEDRRNLKRAELNLAVCEILPDAWLKTQVGVEKISLEGINISMANPDKSERQQILQTLLTKAERLCGNYLGLTSKPGVLAVE